jgi:hypothetical protein
VGEKKAEEKTRDDRSFFQVTISTVVVKHKRNRVRLSYDKSERERER